MFVCDKNSSCIGCNYQYADRLEDIDEEFRDCNNLIEVAEVKHEHWIPKQYPFGNCECSSCHEEYGICGGLLGDYNYCPNCGAKMDEKGRM